MRQIDHRLYLKILQDISVGKNQSEIAQGRRIKPQNLSGKVKWLVDNGLILRSGSTRAVVMKLTPEGETMLIKLKPKATATRMAPRRAPVQTGVFKPSLPSETNITPQVAARYAKKPDMLQMKLNEKPKPLSREVNSKPEHRPMQQIKSTSRSEVTLAGFTVDLLNAAREEIIKFQKTEAERLRTALDNIQKQQNIEMKTAEGQYFVPVDVPYQVPFEITFDNPEDADLSNHDKKKRSEGNLSDAVL